ncbi:MAG: phosphotransferase [Acidimicrobiales bacterium]
MEIDERRSAETELGTRLAAGRDAVVYAVGDDRVLRRTPDERSFVTEACVMEHARAADYPVPQVYRVGPGEMELDRIPGPTMLEDLSRRPWRMAAHARTLADLHHRLHAIAAPDGLEAFPLEGAAIVHLDLHPGNVIISPDGPVVIDWTNARRGPGPVDVALTWIILAAMEVDGSGPMRAVVSLFRRRFVEQFLAHAGRDDARRVLGAVRDYRGQDRNIRPTERANIDRLVAAEGL